MKPPEASEGVCGGLWGIVGGRWILRDVFVSYTDLDSDVFLGITFYLQPVGETQLYFVRPLSGQ